MTTAITIGDDISARILSQVPGVSVYRGEVPANVPSDEGNRAFPYVVLWETPGRRDEMAEGLCGETDGGSIYELQLTIASGKPDWTLEAAVPVRQALDGWMPPGNVERLRDSQTWAPVLLDTEVLPNRWYIALVFRAAFLP